jgi:hypothetical protein
VPTLDESAMPSATSYVLSRSVKVDIDPKKYGARF